MHFLLFLCIALALVQLCSFLDDIKELGNNSSRIPLRTLFLSGVLWLALSFLVPIDERQVVYLELLLLISSILAAVMAGAINLFFVVCLTVYHVLMAAINLATTGSPRG